MIETDENKMDSQTSSIHYSRSNGELEILGAGAFGKVYRGIWNDREIVIKKPLLENSPVVNKHLMLLWKNEIKMQASLSHPNIVSMLGYHTNEIDPAQSYILFELVKLGDLIDLLNTTVHNFSWLDFTFILLGIANALHYLHEKHILHRDVKAENILIELHNNRYESKLGDFGFAVQLKASEDCFISAEQAGTRSSSAPEVLAQGIYSDKSDVYGIAIICYILTARRFPFPSPRSPEDSPSSIASASIPKQFIELMDCCFVPERTQRPSAAEILQFSIFKGLPQPKAISKQSKYEEKPHIAVALDQRGFPMESPEISPHSSICCVIS